VISRLKYGAAFWRNDWLVCAQFAVSLYAVDLFLSQFGSREMRDVVGKLQVAVHVDTDAQLIAHVGSPVSGRIMKLLVFEGHNVEAGEILAMLHSTDLQVVRKCSCYGHFIRICLLCNSLLFCLRLASLERHHYWKHYSNCA